MEEVQFLRQEKQSRAMSQPKSNFDLSEGGNPFLVNVENLRYNSITPGRSLLHVYHKPVFKYSWKTYGKSSFTTFPSLARTILI